MNTCLKCNELRIYARAFFFETLAHQPSMVNQFKTLLIYYGIS